MRACVSVILAGKRGSRHHSTLKFSANKLSNVSSFIILSLGEGLTSLNKYNLANLSGEKEYNEAFRVPNF